MLILENEASDFEFYVPIFHFSLSIFNTACAALSLCSQVTEGNVPTLYVVATPIGNLEDITLRALRVLKEVDAIVAEDTRRARKLLAYYQIKKQILPLHERSSLREEEKIVALLATSTIAYVVDSGTPGISDPGASFVAKVLATYGKEARVIPIPGASAISTLASVTDAPLRHFVFLGFLPKKKGKQTMLKEIADSPYPVMFFESPHRIIKTLKELQPLGEFSLIVGRELTKTFETIYRGSVAEVLAELEHGGVRGECTVLAMVKGKTLKRSIHILSPFPFSTRAQARIELSTPLPRKNARHLFGAFKTLATSALCALVFLTR